MTAFSKVLTTGFVLFFSAILIASPVPENTVEFGDASKFIDFRIESTPVEKNINALKKDLSRQLSNSISKYLPLDNTMQVIITDVDMVGRVYPGGPFPDREFRVNGFRTMEDTLEKAQLSFTYRWLDADVQLLVQDEVKLFNRNVETLSYFQTQKYIQSMFAYETVMFDRWLDQLTKG